MASKSQIIKPIAFSKYRENELAIIDYVEERGLNFGEETKQMWFERIGVSSQAIPKSFIKILELELKNSELSNLDKSEVLEKIAQYFDNIYLGDISILIRNIKDKESA